MIEISDGLSFFLSLTTTDVLGLPDAVLTTRAVIGIFVTMLTILLLPICLALLWVLWGNLLTRGKVINEILQSLEGGNQNEVQATETKGPRGAKS